MPNQSRIRLKTAVEPEDVEKAVAEINERRFKGKLICGEVSVPGFTEVLRIWVVSAPNSRPKKPSTFEPDDDLGFIFWLHQDGKTIEVRHGVHNPWMRWIMYAHEHELARHFGVEKFDGGDGRVATRPDRIQTNFYDYAVYNYKQPLSANDAAFIERFFMKSVPEAWLWTASRETKS